MGNTRPTSVLRCAIGALALLLLPAAAVVGTPPEPAVADTRPNIVLITADDMNLTDLRWMPETRSLLGDAGVEVDGFLSNHPLCCPARAEIITGQYGQNNGVHDNEGPFGGYDSLNARDNHLGAWLQKAGYQTALVGKYLNGWQFTAEHQPGWTIFDPTLRNIYQPYGMTMYNNGSPQTFNNVYTADLMGRRTVNYINRFSASDQPFFIWTSQLPPHNMDGGFPIPADRHENLYPDAVPPSVSDPSFNEADVSDKPAYVRSTPKVLRQRMIDLHRARIRSLASVDEQVAATVDALQATGELDNTYIFFASDNGFLMGEHRLKSKNKPYEQDLRVPLLVRGPGLPAGTLRSAMYGMVDLAPTFLDLAGVALDPALDRTLDGRSMKATLETGAPGYKSYLIQAADDGLEWWWRGVRSHEYVYVRYNDGFEELYDMAKDPAQLQNVASDPAYAAIKADYAERLAKLESCSGTTCDLDAPVTP